MSLLHFQRSAQPTLPAAVGSGLQPLICVTKSSILDVALVPPR